MIEVFYIKNKEPLLSKYLNAVESLIGSAELEQAYRYRRWQDRQANLLGKFLLSKHLEKNGYDVKILKKLSYTEFKRPHLKDTSVDFNISHSGDLVICAFSMDQTVGIDIEKFQIIDLDVYNYILNENDKKRIESSIDKYSSFFDIWSAKEAILKAHGCGLVDELDELQINDQTGFFNDSTYYLKFLAVHPSYSTVLASSTPIENLSIKEIILDDA